MIPSQAMERKRMEFMDLVDGDGTRRRRAQIQSAEGGRSRRHSFPLSNREMKEIGIHLRQLSLEFELRMRRIENRAVQNPAQRHSDQPEFYLDEADDDVFLDEGDETALLANESTDDVPESNNNECISISKKVMTVASCVISCLSVVSCILVLNLILWDHLINQGRFKTLY